MSKQLRILQALTVVLTLSYHLTVTAEPLGITYTADESNPFHKSIFTPPNGVKGIPNDYRSKWHRITGFEYSGLHWGQFVVVYMNKDAHVYKNNYEEYVRVYLEDEDEDDVDISFQPYSEGTIFLKEGYLAKDGRPGAPSSLTIMIKREPGYDPNNGDWEYIQSAVKGQIAMQGKFDDPVIHKVCSDCHSNMAERDYVFSSFYSHKQ